MEYKFKVRKVEFDFADGCGWSPEKDSLELKASAEYNDAYANQAIEVIFAESEMDAYYVLRSRIEDKTGWTVHKVYYDLT